MTANTLIDDDDEVVSVGTPLPRISKLELFPNFTALVTWSEGLRAGQTDFVDFSPIVDSYKIYRPLRQNGELFQSGRLIENGSIVAWDDADMQMPADVVEELAEQTITPVEFAQFLARNKISVERAAAIFGRSIRMIRYYLSTGPIPGWMSLACDGYEARERAKLVTTNIKTTYMPSPASHKPLKIKALA